MVTSATLANPVHIVTGMKRSPYVPIPATEPVPVWVYVTRTNMALAEECEKTGVTAPSLLLTAATRDPWTFVAALQDWGIDTGKPEPGCLPDGIIEAKARYLVDEVRRHGSVLLARPSHGTPWSEADTAGRRVVIWVRLGEITGRAVA